MTATTVSLHQAVANALGGWIAGQLADFTVSNRWPDAARELPPKEITVLASGAPQIEWLDFAVLLATPATGPNQTYTWRVGQVELDMQLDVWTLNHPDLDDAIARLELALHAPKTATIPTVIPPGLLQDPWEAEIVLQLAAPWATVLSAYRFDKPNPKDDGGDAQRRQWRATFEGEATYDYVVTSTQPSLSMIALREQVSTAAGAVLPPGGTTHTLTVTPSGSSSKDGP